MGGFISKRLFPRAKDLSTYGLLLEGLEAEIGKLNGKRASKFAQHRQLVRSLVLYSSAAFVCLCGVMYALADQHSRPVVIAPVIGFPLLVVLVKRAIDAMFDRSVRHDDRILAKLERQKERMLEELIESTKFTQTRQLIDKFGKKPPQAQQQQQMARQQQMRQQQQQLASATNTPRKPTPGNQPSVSPAVSTRTSSFTPPQLTLPGLLPGQPYVTPADLQRFHRTDVQRPAPRGAVDKVIDFALGDGPNNRYALICASCYTHNGLVKEDDLESVRYRCVMCNYINGKKLPVDWKPTIHSNTIESIIQSTPTKQPIATHQQPQQQHAEDDADSSLFFSTSTANLTTAALQLPDSTQLSTSKSSPAHSAAANTQPPPHTDKNNSVDEQKEEVGSTGSEREGGKEAGSKHEKSEKSEKSEHKEESISASTNK